MTSQTTRHIFLIEPIEFYSNPETIDTNVYQFEEDNTPRDAIFAKALVEFRAFQNMLIENGVYVTTAKGHLGCPDMIFPNWFSTHADGQLILYPMYNKNRADERVPHLVDLLKRMYPKVKDYSQYEAKKQPLEATASLGLDHVNKIAYCALSPRTTKSLAEIWAADMGFELITFDTVSHTGKAVYHTDLIINIGEEMAMVCSPCIVEKDRARVVDSLRKYRTVIEIDMDQLKNFLGNSLSVKGENDDPLFVMSTAAYKSLSEDQLKTIQKHYKKILHTAIPTIEHYGGGSARCMMAQLF